MHSLYKHHLMQCRTCSHITCQALLELDEAHERMRGLEAALGVGAACQQALALD